MDQEYELDDLHDKSAKENELPQKGQKNWFQQHINRALPPVEPLIFYTEEEHRLQMNHRCAKLLEAIQKPVAVLAVCGPYLEGKLEFLSHAASVDPSSCKELVATRQAGIWLVTTVLHCDNLALVILLTTNGGDACPCKHSIFAIATVLSSYMVYCSQQLSLCNESYFKELPSSIAAYDGASEMDLYNHLPQLLWIVHDATCSTKSEGAPLVLRDLADLQPQLGSSVDFFPKPKCVTTPPNTGNGEVSAYVLQHISSKVCTLTSQEIDGLTLASFSEQCLETFNSNSRIQLSHTWEKVKLANEVKMQEKSNQDLRKRIENLEAEVKDRNQVQRITRDPTLSPTKLDYKRIPRSDRLGVFNMKLLLLGDHHTGKTSLMEAFVRDEPILANSVFATTISTTMSEKRVLIETTRGDQVSMEIWDTCGQESSGPNIVPMLFREARVVLLVYDATSRKSLDGLIKIWEPLMKDKVPEADVILVSTKNDLSDDQQVSPAEGRKYAKELGTEFYQTSVREHDTFANIEQLFFRAAKKALYKTPYDNKSGVSNDPPIQVGAPSQVEAPKRKWLRKC